MGSKPEYMQEIEEEEDGPPPGFQCLIAPQPLQQHFQFDGPEVGDDEEQEDGPPPGFDTINPKPPPLPQLPSSDTETKSKQEDVEDEEDGPPPGWEFNTPQALRTKGADIEMEGEQDDMQDDADGPPPGWEFSTLSQASPSKPQLNTETRGKQDSVQEDVDGPPPGWEFSTFSQVSTSKPQSNTADLQRESNEVHENEDEDDGPPPGWETNFPQQKPPPCEQPLQLSLAVSTGSDTGSKREIKNDEGSLSGSRPESMSEKSSPPTPPLQWLPSSAPPAELGGKESLIINGTERPASVRQSLSSPQPCRPVTLPPLPVASSPSGQSTEKVQLVCGTCWKLLLYPRGAKWVQCPGCKEVNLALEAQEVGQVNCGSCAVLLMYPYGAPAVRCSSCRSVTQIGAHNRRPPLSVQQAQRRRHANRVR